MSHVTSKYRYSRRLRAAGERRKMAQEYKHSFNGRMKISAGYKPGNMAVFMYGGTKRKRKKKVRGK